MVMLKTTPPTPPNTLVQLSRWIALIEGIEMIDIKAKELKIDLDKCPNMIKPLALQKYIDERQPSIMKDLEKQAEIAYQKRMEEKHLSVKKEMEMAY